MKPQIKADSIKIEDLTGDIRIIAEHCGIDTAISLITKIGGMEVYVPKSNSVPAIREAYILAVISKLPSHLNPAKSIALELSLSVPTVQKDLAKLAEEGKVPKRYLKPIKNPEQDTNLFG